MTAIQGYGAATIGGAGGQILEVTNLNDGGPGSLRAAMEAKGPRIVTPKVAGWVTLSQPITVRESFLTVDGTAAAIGLRNSPTQTRSCVIVQDAEHIMLRNIRLRPGYVANVGNSHRALTVTGCQHVAVDHISCSWGIDICAVFGGCEDLTVQYSIFSEGLENAGHPDGGGHSRGYNGRESDAGIMGRRMTFHHNLCSHVQYRTPQISNSDEWEQINNVIYATSQQGSNVNLDANNKITSGRGRMIGNHYSRIGGKHREINVSDRRGPDTNIYVKGNIGPNRVNATDPELDCVDPDDRDVCQSDDPTAGFGPAAIGVKPQPAPKARARVLSQAGANLPYRDAVDMRIVQQAMNGTGLLLIDREDQVGGYPPLI